MMTNADSSEPPRLSRLIAVALLAWIAMIGADFLLHAGLLAQLYAEPRPFLLPPSRAFALIPLGYLAILLLVILLLWLARRLGIHGARAGFVFGLQLGAIIWGAFVLGLASISTASPSLLAGWLVGQAVELGVGGAVVGSGLGRRPLRSLLLRVLALTFAAFVVTIALQIAGLAPQARFNPRP
jgi:tryptophan-rich sensory protein